MKAPRSRDYESHQEWLDATESYYDELEDIADQEVNERIINEYFN